ncbi:MAG: hypothetical protein CVV00_11845 [Firmicutes bacterium HGW-Firmicutes-5]|jgi:hypothetical protein|nr:MAG: hypothetical protein CVV00_11845 [Firmicutes bacterium HGW-Firmicutes-5]
MKIFRELYIRGNSDQLQEFIGQIKSFVVGDWSFKKSDRLSDYLLFNYNGDKVDNAQVSICVGDRINGGELHVGNIVPLKKSSLTTEEYNAVLMQFYNDIIKKYNESGASITIQEPSDDVFDPSSIISEEALKKLKLFCAVANKSTGSSHPNDQERWFDFICQTVDDKRMFDYTTLADFLQDKEYWGPKLNDNIRVLGDYAWEEDMANDLASEYENACEILLYYKKNKENLM